MIPERLPLPEVRVGFLGPIYFNMNIFWMAQNKKDFDLEKKLLKKLQKTTALHIILQRSAQ